ncbi:uncharacterized protein TM35_000651040 [Trypanosoma theileri]|uniref:Uncharacterized protein n=1 Tax=Trypanosoma theileri TaxID=67003 RepID=A0A1X0NFN0_9TRYP|nr:uncharacterized protein TM35_000651040 [Trypanosoma theileri]ORC83542.1 hypothetical protein TM35_000651040 [Trypanosoma theileri]
MCHGSFWTGLGGGWPQLFGPIRKKTRKTLFPVRWFSTPRFFAGLCSVRGEASGKLGWEGILKGVLAARGVSWEGNRGFPCRPPLWRVLPFLGLLVVGLRCGSAWLSMAVVGFLVSLEVSTWVAGDSFVRVFLLDADHCLFCFLFYRVCFFFD